MTRSAKRLGAAARFAAIVAVTVACRRNGRGEIQADEAGRPHPSTSVEPVMQVQVGGWEDIANKLNPCVIAVDGPWLSSGVLGVEFVSSRIVLLKVCLGRDVDSNCVRRVMNRLRWSTNAPTGRGAVVVSFLRADEARLTVAPLRTGMSWGTNLAADKEPPDCDVAAWPKSGISMGNW